MARSIDQRGELVAAEAGDQVAGAEERGDPRRRLGQHVVARRVPEIVVDRLEAVEADAEHRAGRALPQPLLQAHPEDGAVGRAGERVVVDEVADPVLDHAALAHVLAGRDPAARLQGAAADRQDAPVAHAFAEHRLARFRQQMGPDDADGLLRPEDAAQDRPERETRPQRRGIEAQDLAEASVGQDEPPGAVEQAEPVRHVREGEVEVVGGRLQHQRRAVLLGAVAGDLGKAHEPAAVADRVDDHVRPEARAVLAQAPALGLKAAGLPRRREPPPGQARRPVLGGVEAGEVAPDDLGGGVALGALGPRVPVHHHALGREHVDRVVRHPLHEQAVHRVVGEGPDRRGQLQDLAPARAGGMLRRAKAVGGSHRGNRRRGRA